MAAAAITLLIAIITITNVLKVFVFGLAHLLEVLGEMVAFCATVEEAIVTELEVAQLGAKWRSCSKKRIYF